MTFASAVLYFQQAELVYGAITDRGVRTVFFARIDLAVNILTLLTQGFLAAHILRWLGIGFSLALLPALVLLGFVGLGTYPLLAVLVVLQVLYRSGRYAISRPAREVLFTVVGREERYKSKAFIDAAVYRGGDLVSGWIYAVERVQYIEVDGVALIEKGRAGEVYNVCSGESHSVGDLLERLCELGGCDVEIQVDPDRMRPVDVPDLRGDHGKITKETGWKPAIPIEDTLQALLDDWGTRLK